MKAIFVAKYLNIYKLDIVTFLVPFLFKKILQIYETLESPCDIVLFRSRNKHAKIVLIQYNIPVIFGFVESVSSLRRKT